MKCYSELITIPSFEERYRYLKISQRLGESTFGFDRYLNQSFYKSTEWEQLRHHIIVRDDGFDLAMDGYPVLARGIIHHINPITKDDIVVGADCIFDPENLILCSHKTHNAIHYGDESIIPKRPIERKPNDTCLWK